MIDNWSYNTIPGYPYCGFGVELGYHAADRITIENVSVVGSKYFSELDFG